MYIRILLSALHCEQIYISFNWITVLDALQIVLATNAFITYLLTSSLPRKSKRSQFHHNQLESDRKRKERPSGRSQFWCIANAHSASVLTLKNYNLLTLIVFIISFIMSSNSKILNSPLTYDIPNCSSLTIREPSSRFLLIVLPKSG